MKEKIVIIFPKFKKDDTSHYPYWYQLFKKAGEKLDLLILFESGDKPECFGNIKIWQQKIKIKPFNLLERFYLILKLRLLGYQNFYIHYSYWALLLTKFITSILGGKTFLWLCEYHQKLPNDKLMIRALKSCDVLVTGHQKIAKRYHQLFNKPLENIKIVSNWVNKKKVRNQKSEIRTWKNILFVHHLSKRKGSRQLPKIIKQALEKEPKFRFTIVGQGSDFNFLENFIKQDHLQTQVKLVGEIGQNRINNYYQQADLFILPSKSEGFPRVILESMSWGLPYVAFNAGCVWEISPVKQKAFIVKNNNINLFVKNILEFRNLKSDQLRQIKQANLKQVKKFGLENSVEKFIKLF